MQHEAFSYHDLHAQRATIGTSWEEAPAEPYEAGGHSRRRRLRSGWRCIQHDLDRKKDDVLAWLSKRLPRSIAYWAAIRVGVHATTGRYQSQVVPDLTFLDALERWDK